MPIDTHQQKTPPKNAGRSNILTIVLVYAMFAAGWILLSDKLVQMYFTDPDQIILASMLKGWLYVGITSLLLYGLMQRRRGDLAATKITVSGSLWFSLPFLSLAAVIIAFTSMTIFHTFMDHKEEETGRLQAIADLKARQITDLLKQKQSDADFVQASDFFTEQYRRWQESGDQHSGERLQIQLERLRRNQGLDRIMLLAPDGTKLWESGNAPLAVAQPLQAAAQLAEAERKVRRVGPYLDAGGHMSLDFIAPLTAVPGPAPLVILHVDLTHWLAPILQSWPVPSASAETLLFQRDGDHLLLLNEPKHQQNSAVKLHSPTKAEQLLNSWLLRVKNSQDAPVEGLDDRGIEVIGVVRAIAGTDWLLVSKLDRSELYSEAVRNATWSGLAGLLALFMAGAGFYLLLQNQQLAISQAVQQSQAERLRALQLLSTIADSSDDAIFAKDMAGRYILFNRAAEKFVGRPAQEVLGSDDHDLFPPEQAEILISTDRRAIAENRTLTQEEELDTLKGKRTFLTTKGPLRDSGGNVIGMFGIARDVTDRKTGEAQLRISEERLKLALTAANDGLWDWNLVTGLSYLTPHYYEMTGYRPDQITADFEFFKRTVHPDDLPHVLKTMEAHLQGKTTTSEFDYRMVTASGKIKWIRGRGQVVERDATGTPVRMVGTISDISARKAVEEALRQQTQELAQRNEELERFNRATVGRELDMIALKQQVNELTRQLGREPPYPLAFLDTSEVQSKPEETQ
ncbi:MAG: PAS domain-containing protein [Methylobacter sp.]